MNVLVSSRIDLFGGQKLTAKTGNKTGNKTNKEWAWQHSIMEIEEQYWDGFTATNKMHQNAM
jgi:hypothetical protein